MDVSTEQRIAVVIEDDADIRNLLRTILVQSGFSPILTSTGEDGIEAVRVHEPLLTTLDVQMPGMDGFAVAKRLREFSSTYIIMLTGQTDEIDVIQGLDSGADDYLVKPFRPRELRARVDSLLRRPRHVGSDASTGTHAPPPVADPAVPAATVTPPTTTPPVPVTESPAPQPAQPAPQPVPVPASQMQPTPVQPTTAPVQEATHLVQPPHAPQTTPAVVQGSGSAGISPAGEGSGHEVLDWKGLRVDRATRVATVDGSMIDLTRSEFDLLAALLASGRRVRSKADLVLTLRGEGYVTTYYVNDADKRAVEVHMANLRRKIGDSSTTPRWIETVRGVGYRLAAD